VDAAKYLNHVLTQFDRVSLHEQVETMHEIEKAADAEKKIIMKNL